MSTCSQLAFRLNLLENLMRHAHDPEMQSMHADQIAQGAGVDEYTGMLRHDLSNLHRHCDRVQQSPFR